MTKHDQIMATLTELKTAVCGDGTKGLSERMNEMETWRHSHPRVCPLEEKEKTRWVRIGAECAIISVVITMIILVLKLLKVL